MSQPPQKAAPTSAEVETKVLHVPFLTDAKMADDGRTLTGYGAVYGNIDSDGDVIEAGAFGEGLAAFLSDGFLGWMHDWGHGGPPVGFFTDAREDDHGLYLAARFHTTPAAESVRTWTAERLVAGKSVGLSVGMRVLQWRRDANGVRRITKALLYEVSVVTTPANREAQVTGLKFGPLDLGGPPLDGAAEAASRYLERAQAHVETRNTQGRKVSDAFAASAVEAAEVFERAAKGLRSLVAPPVETVSAADLLARSLDLRSRSIR